MAKLSEETQEIINRLKAEGELSRNRGTHSVRSVKIQLQKFEKVFDSINANTIEQTKMMQMQMGIAKEAIEFQNNKEQFDELKRDAEFIQEDKIEESKGRDNTKIDAFGDRLTKALSMKNIAMGAAGLFVGYNLLKGFIDEQTDGGFSRFINSFKEVNWEGFKEKFNNMINSITRFEEWLDGLPMLLLGGGMVGYAAKQAAFGLASGAAVRGMGPRRGMGGLMNIRGTILLAVTGLAIAYGDRVEDWLVNQAGVDPEVASFAVDAGQAMLGGATLAAMFGLGPTGIIIGAAVGLAFVIGKSIYDWMERKRAAAAAEMRKQLDLVDQLFGLDSGTGGDVSGIIDEAGATDSSALVPSVKTQEALALAMRDGSITGELLENALTDPEAKKKVGEAIANAIDEKVLQNPQSVKNLMGNITGELVASLGEDKDDVNLDQLLQAFQATLGSDNPAIKMLAAEAYQSLVKNVGADGEKAMFGIENFGLLTPKQQEFFTAMAEYNGVSFRRGSGGFRNFGNGTLSMLHGNEAVVNENSPEGQFLRMFQTVVKNRSVGGMEATSGVTVINAPTNVNPNITNTHGGNSKQEVNVLGGMSGDPLVYGLPFFAQ